MRAPRKQDRFPSLSTKGTVDLSWANVIQAAYRSRGMNRAQFQRALGVAYSTVVSWERGLTRPNAHHLERIAQVTGVSLPNLGDLAKAPRARRGGVFHQAFDAFLRHMGRGIDAEERRTLESVVFYGIEPSVATFQAMLVGLRMGRRTRSPKRRVRAIP